MTSSHPTHHDGPARAFLVERYLSPAAAEDLAASTARVARLCADSDPTDAGVRYLYSAYLSTEDTCFCLFRAPSSDAVRAVNNQAHFALDRITDAALLLCVENPPATFPNPGPTTPGGTP
jgi:Protein of unknown function (DUF4242)